VKLDSPPILIIFFNRPDILRQNLLALSRIAPAQLFLACDGPREGVSEDEGNVAECKRLAQELVDWDCKVEMNFAESNHGCDKWVPNAISWFFSRIESGIILEDDCIIDDGFVKLSYELLKKYLNEPKIMSISAANFQQRGWGDGDYYFSKYASSWAWATWARAWNAYDSKLVGVDRIILSPNFKSFISNGYQRKYWNRFFKALKEDKFTYWDSKWVLSIWAAGGISITPNRNLVKNIGFGIDATHTAGDQSRLQRTIQTIAFPIRHPTGGYALQNDADFFHFNQIYKPKLSARVRQIGTFLLRIFKLRCV
jgi:hypothetical protein